MRIDYARPSTWIKWKASMCEGCYAACCMMPVEVTNEDLVRMEVATIDELTLEKKRTIKRLTQEGVIVSYREKTGKYTLRQLSSGDCQYLDQERRCTIYDKRPETCRNFPRIGPRPGYCPARSKEWDSVLKGAKKK